MNVRTILRPARGTAPRAGGARAALRVMLLVVLPCLAAPGWARDLHVAPPDAPGAASGGDGSAGRPFAGAAAALASGAVQPGDRLVLAPGAHGPLIVRGQRFDPPVEIASGPEGRAHVDRIAVADSRGLVLRGLDVWPRDPGLPESSLVGLAPDSSHVVLRDLDIRGGPGGRDYLSWTRRDWLETWRHRGVKLQGPDSALRDSTLSGVSFGVEAIGDRVAVTGNTIRGFSGDGLRGFGADTLFRGNVVRDCVDVDENHDDGFQSWIGHDTLWGPRSIPNMVIDGNTILEWTGPSDHPLRCVLQGISMFQGPFEGWTISNNLVVVSAYHGIALYGGARSRVVNNTVLHPDLKDGNAPWIMDFAAGYTVPGTNVFANNLATFLRLGPEGGQGSGHPHLRNVTGRQLGRFLEDPAAGDYRPRADSPLVDAAHADHAPDHDLTGTPRPQGAAPDIGAFERR